jgi:hypothetical protein
MTGTATNFEVLFVCSHLKEKLSGHLLFLWRFLQCFFGGWLGAKLAIKRKQFIKFSF